MLATSNSLVGFEFTPEQEAWLRDLENTHAPQCNTALTDGWGGYCCLGRAVVAVEGRDPDRLSPEGTTVLALSAQLVHKLHLFSKYGDKAPDAHCVTKDGESYSSLVAMNDSGNWTFKEIAACLRLQPHLFFRNAREAWKKANG